MVALLCSIEKILSLIISAPQTKPSTQREERIRKRNFWEKYILRLWGRNSHSTLMPLVKSAVGQIYQVFELMLVSI